MDVPVQCGAQGLSVGEVLRLLWWAEGEQGACGADELLRAAPCTVHNNWRHHPYMLSLPRWRSGRGHHQDRRPNRGHSCSCWTHDRAGREEPPGGKIVVHAPREPNRARLPREREAHLKVVLELVTKERRSYHRTGRPL